MLSFVGALRAVESLLQPASDDRSPGLHAAVRHDPALVHGLLAMHDALNARFSEVVGIHRTDNEATRAATRAKAIPTLVAVVRRGEGDRAWTHRRLVPRKVVALCAVRRPGERPVPLLPRPHAPSLAPWN